MKLGKLAESEEALLALLAMQLPITVAYKLSVFSRQISEHLTVYHELRNKLLEKYGTLVGHYRYEMDDENAKAFSEELEKIEEQDVEAQVPRVSFDDLGNIKISPKTLALLDWLITG